MTAPWLTQKDAAAYIATSTRRLRELTDKGAITAKRDGAVVKYHRAELDRYMDELPDREPGVRSA